jgi:acyl-CoA synthetase (NDP forming)
VELNLSNEDQVLAAFKQVVQRVTALDKAAATAGVLVQPMYCGLELMIGATRDPQLGPLLAFGLGGTNVEIVRDVCYRLAPLTDREADELLRSIRGYRFITGYRGRAAVDVSQLERLLVRVSQFVAALPEVLELDLNPVMARPGTLGCWVVDARIRVQQ